MKNEGFVERLIQASIASVSFLGAIFWTGGKWQIFLSVFGLMVATFAIIGFCPLYKIFKINISAKRMLLSKKQRIIIFIYASVFLLAGSWASIFFSKKFFVEDFNKMNKDYKQALYETGQEKNIEAEENYGKLVLSYGDFESKYQAYQPFALKKDSDFKNDLKKINIIIQNAGDYIASGKLKDAHLELEKVRPITQDIFKRNGFSMLAISLVDFHDSMEKVLDASNAKDGAGVIKAYEEADTKLSAVEQEANDSEIQNIRKNLDTMLELAKSGNVEKMPDQAAILKSSFVKVYLVRG